MFCVWYYCTSNYIVYWLVKHYSIVRCLWLALPGVITFIGFGFMTLSWKPLNNKVQFSSKILLHGRVYNYLHIHYCYCYQLTIQFWTPVIATCTDNVLLSSRVTAQYLSVQVYSCSYGKQCFQWDPAPAWAVMTFLLWMASSHCLQCTVHL